MAAVTVSRWLPCGAHGLRPGYIYLAPPRQLVRIHSFYTPQFDPHPLGGVIISLLARSLALIAGALRRLAFDELLYALSLYIPPSTRKVSRAEDLAELRYILRSQVVETRIRKLLRPFAELEPTVGFVHQSLEETVLKFPHSPTQRRQRSAAAASKASR